MKDFINQKSFSHEYFKSLTLDNTNLLQAIIRLVSSRERDNLTIDVNGNKLSIVKYQRMREFLNDISHQLLRYFLDLLTLAEQAQMLGEANNKGYGFLHQLFIQAHQPNIDYVIEHFKKNNLLTESMLTQKTHDPQQMLINIAKCFANKQSRAKLLYLLKPYPNALRKNLENESRQGVVFNEVLNTRNPTIIENFISDFRLVQDEQNNYILFKQLIAYQNQWVKELEQYPQIKEIIFSLWEFYEEKTNEIKIKQYEEKIKSLRLTLEKNDPYKDNLEKLNEKPVNSLHQLVAQLKKDKEKEGCPLTLNSIYIPKIQIKLTTK